MVIREQYRDDVADGQFQENRQLFADNKGRYVIHMCRILYLTNDNHFRDDIRSLVFPNDT